MPNLTMMNSVRILLAAALTWFTGACAKNELPSGIRTVSIAPAARQAPLVLAPARATAFARMAEERGSWAVNELRAAISRELAASGRFQAAPSGSGDAQIAIESLRHGLIEVSANRYAVTVAGAVNLHRGSENLGQRDFSGTSGDIRSLAEFEDPAVYEEALRGTLSKVALELVAGL